LAFSNNRAIKFVVMCKIKSLLLILLLAGAAHAQEPSNMADARPTILKALDGDWIMRGDVLGKPARYTMHAESSLHNAFTEMHMTDANTPSKYEARVFIGFDQKSQSLIVHWLDVFGASGSIPHATGKIDGNAMQFSFPYKSATFRDTLTFDPAKNTWVLEIEAAKPDGSWSHFAGYAIARE
jgi:hypothetical protein